jgi:hypothetical protein
MLLSIGIMSFFVFFLRAIKIKLISFIFLLTLIIVRGWVFDLFKESIIGSFIENKISTFFFGFVLMIVSEILLFFSFF